MQQQKRQTKKKINCAPLTGCIRKINNTQIDNAKDLDVVVSIYNLKYSNNHLKTSGGLWQYYRNQPGEADKAAITDYKSLKSKTKLTVKSPGTGYTKDVEIAVPSRYLSNFWRTLKMFLINCEINLILT